MASIDRVLAKVAAGLLPGLLPTPPRSTIAPCVVILPSSFTSKPRPSRADSVERWDAHKKDKKRGSPSSSSCGSSSPGRASSVERWDSNKKFPRSSSSSSRGSSTSSSEASSCERWESNMPPTCGRWDINKKCGSSSSMSSSSRGSSAIPAGYKWDSDKRHPSRACTADRWDMHKKLRSAQAEAESRAGEQDDMHSLEDETMEMVPTARRTDRVFSGSSFFASPEQSVLPMPAFFRSRCPSMISVPAH